MVKANALLASFLVCCVTLSVAQGDISVGLFTGVTSSFTLDEGMNNDARYKAKYDLKLIPIGFSFGVDNRHHGFLISPSVMSIGRNYNVVNIFGAPKGTRKTSLTYFNLPVAYKFHLIDRPSLKTSFLTGLSLGYLLRTKETVSHGAAKYRFPEEIYPVLTASTYKIESDGVIADEIENEILSSLDDYKFLQVFASIGLRTDWDPIPNWRFSVDFRANYGLMEARTADYLKNINDWQEIYSTPGARNDLFASLTLGISRVMDSGNGRSSDISRSTKRITSPKSKPKPVAKKKKKRRR